MVRTGRRLGSVSFLACVALAWPAAATPAGAAGLSTSCRAAAAVVDGSPTLVANPQQTPCAFDSASTFDQSVPLPWISRGFYSATLQGPWSFTYSTSGATSTESASVSTSNFQLDYLTLAVRASGAWSGAQATIGPCPATAQTSGGSGIASLSVNGVGYDGNQQQTIDVPGVATIFVDQEVASAGAITRRALDIKLSNGHEIAVAESTAGASCS